MQHFRRDMRRCVKDPHILAYLQGSLAVVVVVVEQVHAEALMSTQSCVGS
jgi:hypothetical protein